MPSLLVTVGREIQFISSPDLPAAFRRIIAADNTIANPLFGKRKGAPETVQCYHHNPFTKEVILPRGYYPQLLARAEEFGVDLLVSEICNEEDQLPTVIRRQVAVQLQDLRFGLDVLHDLVAGGIPTDWDTIDLQLTVVRHRPLSPDAQEKPPKPPTVIEPNPFPWEEQQNG